MNKFIIMLILGVVAAAMLLVLGMHLRQLPDEETQSPVAASAPGGERESAPGGLAEQARDGTGEAADISPSLRTAVSPPTAEPQPAPAVDREIAGPAADRPAGDAASGQPAVIPARRGSGAPAQTVTAPGRAAGTRPAPATASVSRGQGNIVQVGLHFRGRGMALVIEGDGPLPVRQFVLEGPDRLVVDLPGAWRNLKAPAVPGNNLVKAVRLGRQGDADRLVLDLKTKLRSHDINRISDKKVEILFD